MPGHPTTEEAVGRRQDFYRKAYTALRGSGVPFLVGGAYALSFYTEVRRDTKDMDLFLRAQDVDEALRALSSAGFRTERTFSHWLAKALGLEDEIIDLIFNSGNGVCPVDDEWFEHSRSREVLGLRVRLVPPEELIWQKAYILERDRCDDSDIAHIVLSYGDKLDWPRLIRRFGSHWALLLSHLVLFGFVFPSERRRIPDW